ncbi:MAG: outer membrane protein assembly factor BamE [Gemmobacter sp.]
MAKAGSGARLMLAALVFALIAGCSEVIRYHGYAPTDDDLATLTVGRDTRETVARKVGRPGAGGIMADGGWYYTQSKFRHYGARAPQEVDREVVAISFDSAGRVENIERFGLEQGRVVPLSRRVTESGVRGMGVIRQLLSNIGNFNPAQFLGQGPARTGL